MKIHSKMLIALVSPVVLSICACSHDAMADGAVPDKPERIDGMGLEDFDRAIEISPRDPNAYVNRGYFHERRDERETAIEDFSKALELDPKNGEALSRRAEMYCMTNRLDNALADANQLITFYPKWANSYDKRARVQRTMERYAGSIADLEIAQRLSPNNVRPLEDLAECYDLMGQHVKALEAATRHINLCEQIDLRNLDFAYRDRGWVFSHAHRYDDAIRDFKKGLEVNSKFAGIWGYLAEAYAAEDKLDEAEAAMKMTQALETFPPRGFRLRGEMHRAAGEWQKAIESYTTSTSMEPTYGPGFMQKALAEIAIGDFTNAERDLKKAVALNRYSAASYSYLAFVCSQLHNTVDAENYMETAFWMNPDLPILYVNRARIYLQHGDVAHAVDDCNKALTIDPLLADAYDLAAAIMAKTNQPNEEKRFIDIARTMGWKAPLKKSDYGAGESSVTAKIIVPPMPNLAEAAADKGDNSDVAP